MPSRLLLSIHLIVHPTASIGAVYLILFIPSDSSGPGRAIRTWRRWWSLPNTRVSSVSSNEHDCGAGINYGNQQGDYAGLVSYGGVSHPIWTDSRFQLNPSSSCRTNLTIEEVFTATVGNRKPGK